MEKECCKGVRRMYGTDQGIVRIVKDEVGGCEKGFITWMEKNVELRCKYTRKTGKRYMTANRIRTNQSVQNGFKA